MARRMCIRMTASARSDDPSPSAETSSRVKSSRVRGRRRVAPERHTEAARDARRRPQRRGEARAGRQPRSRARGTPRSSRSGPRSQRASPTARVRERHQWPSARAAPRSHVAQRAPQRPARAGRGSRRGRSGRRSRTSARWAPRRGSMSTRPSPSSARAPLAQVCANCRSASRAIRSAAVPPARTRPRGSPRAAPRRHAGSSSGWAWSAFSTQGVHTKPRLRPKASERGRILHSKRAPTGCKQRGLARNVRV